ncbi:MAG: hypothetical protein RLZ14_823, partial [Actinomycetota bacterium]
TVDASVSQRHSTPLLLGLLTFVVLDVLFLLVRACNRRREARQRVAEPSTTTVSPANTVWRTLPRTVRPA